MIKDMNNRITIIEGPTPEFHTVGEEWAISLNEGPFVHNVVITNLRTGNGEALMERCRTAWAQQEIMYLDFRDNIGMEQSLPIIAAQLEETPEGQVILLWLRMDQNFKNVDITED